MNLPSQLSVIVICVTLLYLLINGMDNTTDDDKTIRQLRAINNSVIMIMLLIIFSSVISWVKNHSDYEELNIKMDKMNIELTRLKN